MNRFIKGLAFTALSLGAVAGVANITSKAEVAKETVAETTRTNVKQYTGSISENKGFTHYSFNENLNYMLSFDCKIEGDSPTTRITFQDTSSGWKNISYNLMLDKTGPLDHKGYARMLEDGWMNVNYPLSEFNGDGYIKGGKVINDHLNLDLIYGETTGTLSIDFDTFKIVKRKVAFGNKSKALDASTGFSVPMSELQGKNLYFEFRLGSGELCDFSFCDNWENVTGNCRLWNSGSITNGGVNTGYLFQYSDGWKAISLPAANFDGNGIVKENLTRAYCGHPGCEFELDISSIKVDNRPNVKFAAKGVEFNTNAKTPNMPKLMLEDLENNNLYFEYRMLGDGVNKICFQNNENTWNRITDYVELKRSVGETNYGTIEALGNEWFGITIPWNTFANGDGVTRNFINFAYAGATKMGEDIVFDMDSFKIIENKTFEMVKGASIRLDGANGLRFRATLKEKDLVADAKYHMVIIPLDYVETYGLDGDFVEQLGTVPFIDMECEPQATEGGYYIQGSIVNIKEANMARKFVPVAYRELDGVRTYATGSAVEEYARSYYEVAYACMNDKTYFNSLTETQKAIVANVIESQDMINTLSFDFYTDKLGHDWQYECVNVTATHNITVNFNTTTLAANSAKSLEISANVAEECWDWILIDLGSVRTINSVKADMKFVNAQEWIAFNTFSTEKTCVSANERGTDFDHDRSYHHAEITGEASNIRYIGICVHFVVGANTVYIDNLSVE